jgi:hypothetical protein
MFLPASCPAVTIIKKGVYNRKYFTLPQPFGTIISLGYCAFFKITRLKLPDGEHGQTN